MTPDGFAAEPWRLFLALAGPFVGTLAATWAVAWPRLPRPLWGGSACGRCGTPVPLWRQVPLISWALAKGGRRCCEGRIPWSYPLGEAAGLVVGLISGLLAADGVEGTLRFLLGVTLIYASLVDLRRYVIPVQAIAVVAMLGVAGQAVKGDWPALSAGLTAAALTAAAFEALRRVSALTRPSPALGAGDGLLAAALAVWLGPQTAMMVAIAAGLALVVQLTPTRRAVPAFGWALAVAGLGLVAAP